MKKKKEKLKLPEGIFEVEVMTFEKSDIQIVQNIYKGWREISNALLSFGARALNIPEGLSEPVFCLAMPNCVRVISSIPGANSSFDCFDLKENKRIQVKACSVLPDLTSFGPKSEWDEIYFMDFYADGAWNGEFRIYHIDTKDIYSQKVNAKNTVQDFKDAGKRPRFSIYKGIIEAKKIKPIFTGNIYKL